MSFKNKFSNLGQPNKIWVVKSPVQGTMPREIDGQARAASKESP